jgi:pyruvate dehydrogenase E2 component (dihydrolipoamide acetyltransferase)
MPEVTMPRLSDTMQEGTISKWLKQPGDTVKKGDVLGEIETDKATMDLEAYEAGVLEQILVPEGETVPIGQAIAIIGSGAGTTTTPAPKQEQPVAQASASTTVQAPPANTISTPTEAPPAGNGATGVKASPLARRMAEEHHLDLSQLRGTGPGGRIVRDDIEDALGQRTSPAPAPQAAPAPAAAVAPTTPVTAAAPASPPPPEDAELVKLSRVQQIIARRLAESKQTIPHFYVSSEVDMTDLLALRQILNTDIGEDGVKVTVNDLIVKAAALALEKFPEVNSSLRGDSFVRYKHIHVGMAVDAPTGLVVPVIHDANLKGVRSIARESKALIAKARNNKLAPADLEGGTFSVSNLGMMDASNFIAVINPPQAAILAVAATHKQFVPIDGQPVIRDLMTMTMSTDHRILSGAAVARFLQEVKRLLQNPYSLLG